MHTQRFRTVAISPHVFSVIACLVTVVFSGPMLGGCAGPRRTGGSSLSEAAEESKKEPEEEKKTLRTGTPVYKPSPPPRSVYVAVETETSNRDDRRRDRRESTAYDPKKPKRATWFYTGGAVAGSYFDDYGLKESRSLSIFEGLAFRETKSRLRGEVEFSYSETGFSESLTQGFTNGKKYTLGWTLKNYLTADHTFAGVYTLFGIRGGLMRWTYKNPLSLEDEFGDVFEAANDWIWTWSPYAGIGFGLVQTRLTHLGLSLRGGLQLASAYTNVGLRNDVFEPSFYGQFRLEVSFPTR